jgi:hypothetical protein
MLRDRSGEILASWIVQFERSLLRFRRSTKAATHTAQVANLVEALSVAVESGIDHLVPGANAVRELERSAAFLGAQFASEGATGFDIAALLFELRDVVVSAAEQGDAAALSRLFEWLTTVALDSFAASGMQSLRERQADQLENGTPVIEVMPKVPAVLLVGAPSTQTIDSLLARAWMLAVGTGAACLIIDCGGLAEPGEKNFDGGYRRFLDQAQGSALQVVLSAARRPLRESAARLTAEHGLSFQHFDRFDSAVAHSLERAGYLALRRA